MRGFSNEEGLVEMKDYTSFEDGFGKNWLIFRFESIQCSHLINFWECL